MRLPNGMGSIIKREGNRRRPYQIRKTVLDESGKNKRITIGWTETKQEAMELLLEYNQTPWNTSVRDSTFTEVYELWMKHKAPYYASRTVHQKKGMYKNYCSGLYNMPYREIRLIHFMKILEQENLTKSVKFGLRKLFRSLDDVAYEFDIINKKYSKLIPSMSVEESTDRKPFSEEEIELLWNSLDIPDVDLVLMLIYTGFRSQEFSDLLIDNVDLKEDLIVGGSKTKAGKNRKVPIHPRIKPLLEDRINQAVGVRLLNYQSKTLRQRFKKVMVKLNMDHIPHECRYTLRTRLDNVDANKVSIDMILGHKSNSIGERVYTKKTIIQLKQTINLLD